jgi:hypothetical protein
MAPDTAARLEAPLDIQGAAGGAQDGVLAVLAPRLSVSSDRASSASLGSVERAEHAAAHGLGSPVHLCATGDMGNE